MDDKFIKSEIVTAFSIAGQRNCDFPKLIGGLMFLLTNCNPPMRPLLGAAIDNARIRWHYILLNPPPWQQREL
jgi:hypothetical protein